jgi:hypothetical protein
MAFALVVLLVSLTFAARMGGGILSVIAALIVVVAACGWSMSYSTSPTT